MKYKNGKALAARYLNGKACMAIYKVVGGVVYTIWEAVRSCFGSGMWNGERPWTGADAWKSI